MSAVAEASQPKCDSPESARDLVLKIADTMDKLLAVVEQETTIVRAGKLSQLGEIETTKSELAKRYMRDMEQIKAHAPYIGQVVPELVEEFRRAHQQFRAALELNLTVLATAHAVSEGIVRGVATEMGAQNRPQTYSGDGRAAAGYGPRTQPIAVSKKL